jgi:hypothetical protein
VPSKRGHVEDSEDAPIAIVVDLLNSDEPMGLSDRQESDESSSADVSDSSSGED